MFIANDIFKENEDGSFKKIFDIEKFILFDLESDYTMISGLHNRIKFNTKDNNQHLYSIWLAKGMMESITNKKDNRFVSTDDLDESMINFFVEHSTIIK